MSTLTNFQIIIIKELGKLSLFKHFFLTGGTALAEFYLHHRYSDDLDFFTEEDNLVAQIFPNLIKIANRLKVKIEFGRRFETFAECFFIKKNERVRIDFAKDIPFRLKPKIYKKSLGIYVDNQLDIACNKFSALFDRHEVKDFVDIYFLGKDFMPFEEIYQHAKKKHIGLDDYWLAVALRFIEEKDNLPKMIKKIAIGDLKIFYREKIKKLMEKIKDKSSLSIAKDPKTE